jgi:hypothetical protein
MIPLIEADVEAARFYFFAFSPSSTRRRMASER